MYRNIVFDLGGVVIDYNPKEYLMEKFFHERTERRLYEAVFGSREWELLDKGELTWEQAQEIFTQRGVEKNMNFEMQALLEEWTEMLGTRAATVALMRLLKKRGFKLYYLSNIAAETLELVRQRDFWELFDGGVASCELHICKPDLEIYQELVKRYNLVPQETIFTDDNRTNATMAFQAGITGIHFTNVKGLCKMMVTYGIDI